MSEGHKHFTPLISWLFCCSFHDTDDKDQTMRNSQHSCEKWWFFLIDVNLLLKSLMKKTNKYQQFRHLWSLVLYFWLNTMGMSELWVLFLTWDLLKSSPDCDEYVPMKYGVLLSDPEVGQHRREKNVSCAHGSVRNITAGSNPADLCAAACVNCCLRNTSRVA